MTSQAQTTMTAAEFRESKQPKRNKYGAKKVLIDGVWFDSGKEGDRYLVLKDMLARGEISNLDLQPRFKLKCGDQPILIRSDRYKNGRQASVKFDFAYWDGNKRVVEDVKGGKATRTEAYALRKAIVEAMHPAIRVVEV